MFLETLWASVSGNMITGKGVARAEKRAITTDQEQGDRIAGTGS